jgi:outer membrane receptor protein involved in Fe transport
LTGDFDFYDLRMNRQDKMNAYLNNVLFSESLLSDKYTSKINNQNYTLFYKKVFVNPRHEIKMNTNFYFMQRRFLSNYSDSILFSGTIPISIWQEKTNNNQQSITSKFDYSYKGDVLKIESGYQLYLRNITNEFITKYAQNDFEYHELRNALYGNLIFEKSKYGLQIGTRIETTNITIDSNFDKFRINPLFSFSSSYKITNDQVLRFSYNRRISYPTYRMLLPFNYFTADSLSSGAGNRDLKPAKSDKFELNYALNKGEFSFELSSHYKKITDLIDLEYKLNNRVLYSKLINLPVTNVFGGDISLSYTFLILSLDISGNLDYFDFPNSEFNGFSHDISLEVYAFLPGNITLAAMANFIEKSRKPYGYDESNSCLEGIMFSKQILKNKAEISVSYMYPFIDLKSDERRWNEYFSDRQHSIEHVSTFGIGFTYFFTKGKQTKNSQRELNMEHYEEKK